MFLYFGWFCVGHHLFAMAFGEDIWWVDPDDLTNAMLLLYLSMPIYLSLLGLAKAALVCFYLRLFPHQRFRRLCYIVLAIVACLTVAWTAISIFECTPIHYNWDGWKEEMTGTCIDRLTLMYVISGVNIGLDAAIMAMPIPLVLKMRSTPRRKFSIIVMFSLGILVLAASSIRLHYIVVFGGSKNFTYDFVDMLIWTGIEIAVSIITTSLPCIRLMLHRRFPGLLTRIFRLGGHGDDREYVEKYLEPQKAIRTPTVRSRRFILFNRHEPPVPPTIGGDIQEDISPKKQLEARKAKHMAALRRGVGDASRALASILGTVTDTLHRPMSISVLASGDRETENRMGMGMAPSAFARTLNERLDGIRSSIGALPKEKPPKSL
ncbi:hypothetical protein GQ53DRAFT_744297 [Thozetella sp. PMI_491]|nr:hypothetical protein GQ53DRAFT_744297 [Thozetella sp. PMI_491]